MAPDSTSSSTQENSSSCICVLAYPRTNPPNQLLLDHQQLIIKVSVAIGAVSLNPINIKVSPKIHYSTTKTFNHPRQAFLISSAGDQVEQYDIISNMIDRLEIPFRLENILWGILDFPADQNAASEHENLDRIKDRLLDTARVCAANNKTGYMDIHIRKVDKLAQEDYEKLFFADEKNKQKGTLNNNLNDWILENVNDVNLHGITCLGVIHKLALASPGNNKYFGLKSIKIKDEEEEEDEDMCCSICMKGFERGTHVLRMPCSHIFHGFCILRWIHVNPSCPFCRFELCKSRDLD